jgi:hypothetical protein
MNRLQSIEEQLKEVEAQEFKYTNVSTNDKYPKTLVIRNTKEGMIWQIYNVEKEIEAIKLSANAFKNGFLGITLEDFDVEAKETFPNWRESKGGKEIINS